MKRLTLSLLLIYCIVLTSCSQAQIDRALNIISGVPAIVTALHLASESNVLTGISEITASIKIFRDNPTRGNYRNALAVIDGLLQRNVFHVNQSLLAVILAVRAILAGIIPAGAERAGSASDRVSPKAILKEDVDRLEQSVRELKESVNK